MGKQSKLSSSTEWRLGENVVLQLMECLTPIVNSEIFMNNCFTSFRLLTHLGANNIRAACVLNKNGLRKCTSLGTNSCKKKECGHFEQRTSSKKVTLTKNVTLTVLG